jgi:hypothetical protein
VLNTRLASIPFSNGLYRLGSKVSVWAIPPAIQSRITVSAEELIFGTGLQPGNHPASGAPAAMAARLAPEHCFRKVRRFHFELDIVLVLISKLIEIQDAWP